MARNNATHTFVVLVGTAPVTLVLPHIAAVVPDTAPDWVGTYYVLSPEGKVLVDRLPPPVAGVLIAAVELYWMQTRRRLR